MNDPATSGLEGLIQVFFEVPDSHGELTARGEHILDTLRLAERLGISFDSPTIVLEREQARGEREDCERRRPAFIAQVSMTIRLSRRSLPLRRRPP